MQCILSSRYYIDGHHKWIIRLQRRDDICNNAIWYKKYMITNLATETSYRSLLTEISTLLIMWHRGNEWFTGVHMGSNPWTATRIDSKLTQLMIIFSHTADINRVSDFFIYLISENRVIQSPGPPGNSQRNPKGLIYEVTGGGPAARGNSC